MPFFVKNKCYGSAHNIYSVQLLEIARYKKYLRCNVQHTKDIIQISHKSHRLTADDCRYGHDDLKLCYRQPKSPVRLTENTC